MSEHIYASVLSALKAIVQSARIISISADEIITVDNTSWLGVHVYVMDDWKRVLHLLHLSPVSDGTADHLTSTIIYSLLGGRANLQVHSTETNLFWIRRGLHFLGTQKRYHCTNLVEVGPFFGRC